MAETLDILKSIATQIPDVDAAGNPEYLVIPKATLLLWINDAARIIAGSAPVIMDWTAVPSVSGQDVYILSNNITDVRKGWYNLRPLTLSSEADNIFIAKIGGNSWWLSPHSQSGEGNGWQLWPAPTSTGAATTLTGAVTDSQLTLPIANSVGFLAYGFAKIDNELVRYANIPAPGAPGSITNVIRGQGGTAAVSHLVNTTVTDCNIMLQVSRMPTKLVADTDSVEIPQSLWPILELYVLSKVRESEQRSDIAINYKTEFQKNVEVMANKAQLNKPRQGLQVRTHGLGPSLYYGRLYVP